MKRYDSRRIATILFGIYAMVILWVTIFSRKPQKESMAYIHLFSFLPTIWSDILHGDVSGNTLGNIFLFIPAGVLFPLLSRKRKLWKAVLAGGCFSLMIEMIQFVAKRGYLDPDDVLLNVLGTGIGYMLFMVGVRLGRAISASRESDTNKKPEEKTV